jgi:hypothetical protein
MLRAADGHAGIPQENRLLFRGLALLDDVQLEGLMQSTDRLLARGLPAPGTRRLARLRPDEQALRLGRLVITLEEDGQAAYARTVVFTVARAAWQLCGGSQTLTYFNASHFRDYLWWRYFARTLPAEDIELVTGVGFRVARMPWIAMQLCAYVTQKMGMPPLFPRLDTSGIDVMVAQTPYPASVAKSTQLVVRYHDAIPLTMPYTIGERYYHQAFHYQALRHNVARGAWFACVSEATRNELLGIFPQAAERSVTIHNMVSHDYFDEASTPDRVPEIIKMRPIKALQKLARPSTNDRPVDEAPSTAQLDYLLVVSRIEPRKNHLALLSAWEYLRSTRFPALQLIVVGDINAQHIEPIVEKFRPWIEKGAVHMLENVPSAELRLLYKHARATVCPSVAEGFDYSGVEAMRCGGVVVASDIPVHREIYDDAAIYFKSHDLGDAVRAIETVIDPAQPARRAELIERGAKVSARYLPPVIMPQWQAFLRTLTDARARSG